MSGDSGKCELLGPVGLTVQGVMGILAIGSLVWKRYHEHPHRRPWKIWFYDVSKQVIGASFVHMLNLFLSIISKLKIRFAISKSPNKICDNPCDYYFLNLLFDTTVGIPILYLFITSITHFLARVAVQGVTSGEYGNPPRMAHYFKQLLVYLASLGLMKGSIYLLLISFPVVVRLAIWLLSRLDNYPDLQVGFVLLVFPLVMNTFQYYVVDSLIQSPEYYMNNKRMHESGFDNDGIVDEELPEQYGSI